MLEQELLMRPHFYARANLAVGHVVHMGRDGDVVLVDFSRETSGASNKGDEIGPAFGNELGNRSRRAQISSFRRRGDQVAPGNLLIQVLAKDLPFAGGIGQPTWHAFDAYVFEER